MLFGLADRFSFQAPVAGCAELNYFEVARAALRGLNQRSMHAYSVSYNDVGHHGSDRRKTRNIQTQSLHVLSSFLVRHKFAEYGLSCPPLNRYGKRNTNSFIIPGLPEDRGPGAGEDYPERVHLDHLRDPRLPGAGDHPQRRARSSGRLLGAGTRRIWGLTEGSLTSPLVARARERDYPSPRTVAHVFSTNVSSLGLAGAPHGSSNLLAAVWPFHALVPSCLVYKN